MTTLWKTNNAASKIKKGDFVKKFYLKNCAKYGLDPDLDPDSDPDPKLFQSRIRNRIRKK